MDFIINNKLLSQRLQTLSERINAVSDCAIDRISYEKVWENFGVRLRTLSKSEQSSEINKCHNQKSIFSFSQYIDEESRKVNHVANAMLTSSCGKTIDEHRRSLIDISTAMHAFSEAVNEFELNGGMDEILSRYRANDEAVIKKGEEIMESYRDLRSNSAKIRDIIFDAKQRRSDITADPQLCYENMKILMQESEQEAKPVYSTLKSLGDDMLDKVDEKVLTDAICKIESEYPIEQDFAQALAEDHSVEDVNLREYLRNRYVQKMRAKDNEFIWLDDRMLDFDYEKEMESFIISCMRICNIKFNSWSKSLAVLYRILTEHLHIAKNNPKLRIYFVEYAKDKYPPTKAPAGGTIANNFSNVKEEDIKKVLSDIESRAYEYNIIPLSKLAS